MTLRATFVVILLAGLSLAAQNFISAKAGLLNYEEGVRSGGARQLQEGEVFSTPNRAEVLMMPGTFLRLERSAEIRMLSTSLEHPSFELLGGLASLEVDELQKQSRVTVAWTDYREDRAIVVDHKGLYRFEVSDDGTALKIMVQVGELKVPGYNGALKDGQELVLSATGASRSTKFNRKLRDDFDMWSANRAEMLSMASYQTARATRSAYGSGYGSGFAGMGFWGFNPYLGMFSYIPYRGVLTNVWGYGFYSPGYVSYYPYPNYGGGGGNSIGRPSTRSEAIANGSFQGDRHPAPRIPRLDTSTPGSNSGYSIRSGDSGGFAGSIGPSSSPSFGGSIGSSSGGSSSSAPAAPSSGGGAASAAPAASHRN